MLKKPHYYNRPLKELFQWQRNPKGEVGIEIEVEGGPWPEGSPGPNWVNHVDNSLRNNGMEFVIRQPINRDKVLTSVQDLKKALVAFGSGLDFSYRTSVHVHINVQDLTLRQWCSYVALFTVLEEVLVDVVGPKRAGNKFCLRMKDADEPLQMIRRGLRNNNFHDILHDDIKYASMNILATRTHGTLEFRAMEGNIDPANINDWVQILATLKGVAKGLDNPQDIMGQISAIGPHAWVRSLLPRDNTVTERVLRHDNLSGSVYEGVRMAQDVCYAVGWEACEPSEEAPEPALPHGDLRMADIGVADGWGFIADNPVAWHQRVEPMFNHPMQAIHIQRPVRRRVGARIQPPRNPFAEEIR